MLESSIGIKFKSVPEFSLYVPGVPKTRIIEFRLIDSHCNKYSMINAIIKIILL